MRRRPDRFHELESVFLPLDLADEVELEAAAAPAARVELALEPAPQGVPGPPEGVPAGPHNLAAAAARAFLEAAGLCASVRIGLRKRIPAAAGLGGGSSDAAAVLRLLARHFPEALGTAALERVALELGADVPFFLDPRPALVSGIGERCEPLGGWPAFALLLANPGVSLPTARVFSAFDSGTAKPAAPLRPLVDALRGSPEDDGALRALVANDLEDAARGLAPAVADLWQALAATGPRAISMSGSGATLYGVYASEELAHRARARLAGQAWVRVARTPESR